MIGMFTFDDNKERLEKIQKRLAQLERKAGKGLNPPEIVEYEDLLAFREELQQYFTDIYNANERGNAF